jgi:2-aminomuconate deaminase
MTPVYSEFAPDPVGPYPHARKVGNLLFLSGVGPRKKGTKEIPGVTLDENKNIISYNIEEQCHAVFQNVKFVLEASGARWENLVDVTVFLTNMKTDFAIFNKIYAEYFPDKATQPCRTTVEVNALPTPIAIELKCVAVIDEKN